MPPFNPYMPNETRERMAFPTWGPGDEDSEGYLLSGLISHARQLLKNNPDSTFKDLYEFWKTFREYELKLFTTGNSQKDIDRRFEAEYQHNLEMHEIQKKKDIVLHKIPTTEAHLYCQLSSEKPMREDRVFAFFAKYFQCAYIKKPEEILKDLAGLPDDFCEWVRNCLFYEYGRTFLVKDLPYDSLIWTAYYGACADNKNIQTSLRELLKQVIFSFPQILNRCTLFGKAWICANIPRKPTLHFYKDQLHFMTPPVNMMSQLAHSYLDNLGIDCANTGIGDTEAMRNAYTSMLQQDDRFFWHCYYDLCYQLMRHKNSPSTQALMLNIFPIEMLKRLCNPSFPKNTPVQQQIRAKLERTEYDECPLILSILLETNTAAQRSTQKRIRTLIACLDPQKLSTLKSAATLWEPALAELLDTPSQESISPTFAHTCRQNLPTLNDQFLNRKKSALSWLIKKHRAYFEAHKSLMTQRQAQSALVLYNEAEKQKTATAEENTDTALPNQDS